MLIDNILFLRERYPVIRTYFSDHDKDLKLEHFEILDSRAGCKTIRYQSNDDKPLMIHSIYDPVREAERIIASHQEKITEKTHVFFYGIGMGYHVEKFIELYPNNSYSLYEPVPEVFFEMSEHKELRNVINKNTSNLYIDRHNEDTLSYLDEFSTSNENIHLIVLPSYKNIAKEKYEQFHKNIRETILNRRTNLHTDASFQKLWVMNSLINFETVLNTPNMLKNIDRSQFEGKPALIVSAGPSLAEDIEYIRHIKENNLAYIFSVGSAINSLIEYDVLPDAVFTYDPKERNQNVFKKMFKDNIDSIPMVFGSSVGFETIMKYSGPKVHFITSQDKASLYYLQEQIDLEQDVILDAPSIAVMTFQILNKLGASPIIFAGQNLGYLNGRRFSKGIDYAHIPTIVDNETLEKAITTQDVYGNEIKTNTSFNNMRESIERFVHLYKDNVFINTTKGGASIKGVPFVPIEQVIKETLIRPLQKQKWWESITRYNQSEISRKITHLKNSKMELLRHFSLFEKLLHSISLNTKIKNEPKLLSDLQKFDNLYNKLNDNLYFERLLSFYLRIQVKYIANEIKRMNQEPDIFIKGRDISNQFLSFISQCKRGSLELEELLSINIHNKFQKRY